MSQQPEMVVKKKIDPKYFDPEKGAQCFLCHNWGHKAKDCPKKVGLVVSDEDDAGSDKYNVKGRLGIHECDIVLDTGAALTVVASDLVPDTALLDSKVRIKGIHATEEVPLARLWLTIGDRRLWLTAAVAKEPPSDVLLGQDCAELDDLLREALGEHSTTPAVVAVTTRQQAKNQKLKDKLDQLAEAEWEEDFPFGESVELDTPAVKQPRPRLTRREKRQQNLMIFQESEKDPKDEVPLDSEGLKVEQKADLELKQAWEAAEAGHPDYVVENGLLYKWKGTGESVKHKCLVVPKKKRAKLLALAHGSPLAAHLGRRKTLNKLARRFHWPGMSVDVRQLLQQCVECQKGNRLKQGKAPMVIITTPFERVAIDIVGPLPMTAREKRFILTIMDMATRYPEAKALRRVDTHAILKPLINFFSRFEFPAEILSDRGSNFTSKLMKEVTKRLKI